jgi:hypothetical protein
MPLIRKYFWFLLSVTVLVFIVTSCSSVPMLNVNYTVPDKTSQLSGKAVLLEIKDSRQDKEMFGSGAKEEFLNATETISLSVAEGSEKGFKVGMFPLPDLMKRIFKERLNGLGMRVVTDKDKTGAEPKVVIDIKAFKLELTPGTIKRNWKASMTYGVEISTNGKTLAGTTITGQSERLRIIGKKEADSLASDLITDLVNRLDVQALFKQAGLV